MTESADPDQADDASAPTGGRTRPVLRDAAYQQFMEHMFRGNLRPGRLISQRELCELTGSPISAVREALKRLEAEGVITLIPQRGVLVREISATDLQEAYELRAIIELHAVRLYAAACRMEDVQEMRRVTQHAIELQASGAKDVGATFRARMAADEMLHAAIIGSMNNSMAQATFDKVVKTIRLARLGVFPRFAAQAPALREHLLILEALAKRDGDAAVEALRNHLDQARMRALGLI